jgi:hypothetical protein
MIAHPPVARHRNRFMHAHATPHTLAQAPYFQSSPRKPCVSIMTDKHEKEFQCPEVRHGQACCRVFARAPPNAIA